MSSVEFSGHLDSGCHYMTGDPSVFHNYDGTTDYGDSQVADDFQKDCDIPSAEVSTFEDAWFSDLTAKWKGTLSPPTQDFGGRAVEEASEPVVDGDGQYDSCYFPESRVQYATLSGGLWQVGKNGYTGNDDGPDAIGWIQDAVTYYRGSDGQNGIPCGFRRKQDMSIACSAAGDWQIYKQNVIGSDIFDDHVTSIRDGNTISTSE